MENSIYKVVYSGVVDESFQHLPITVNVNFRKFERACGVANRLHAQRRNVIIVECHPIDGMVNSWELNHE